MLANLPSQIATGVGEVTGFISGTGESLLKGVGLTPERLSNAAVSVQQGLSGVLDVDLNNETIEKLIDHGYKAVEHFLDSK